MPWLMPGSIFCLLILFAREVLAQDYADHMLKKIYLDMSFTIKYLFQIHQKQNCYADINT